MAGVKYDVPFSAVALAGTTAKTVVGVMTVSTTTFKVIELCVSFDTATAARAGALVEICNCTFATNPPGTNSTTVTPSTPMKRDDAHSETVLSLPGKNWTTEPTVLVVKRALYVPQYQGVLILRIPDDPFIVKASATNGFAIRITSPDNVNCSGWLSIEE